jgi:metal-sulfur cluster biosynthetic enzyme
MSDNTASSRLVWQADSQDQAKADAIREALREVVDPEIGLNIIELGLIRDLDIQPDKTNVRMILTTPFCPYGPALIEETRKKVVGVSGSPAVVEMSPEMWDPSMMEEGAGADWGLF